jgi:hypothetical protein
MLFDLTGWLKSLDDYKERRITNVLLWIIEVILNDLTLVSDNNIFPILSTNVNEISTIFVTTRNALQKPLRKI